MMTDSTLILYYDYSDKKFYTLLNDDCISVLLVCVGVGFGGEEGG